MFKRTMMVLLGLLCCSYISCLSAALVTGKIHFPVAMKEDALPFFINGVLFLHNFDYERAREQFQLAAQRDPTAVMPYWGEAMTYNHPLWGEVDVSKGQQVLARLGKTNKEQLAKATNAKERGFIAAVQALFGAGEKTVRDQQYLRIMRDLYARFPDDQELAMFYALALLGSAEGERNFTIYMQAAALAEEVARKNPWHPGAIHYAIHAFDDPLHAPLGLYYARRYSSIAPDAAHALHMPSHIYLALGLWHDVIGCNAAAWQAGLKNNPTADAKQYTVHDLHALQWLSYGYLQIKEFTQALKAVKKMEEIVSRTQTPMTKWYYSMMRAAYLVESQDWQAPLKTFDLKGVELNAIANAAYVDSVISLKNKQKNTVNLLPVADYLQKLCEAIPTKKSTHCGDADYFTSITDAGIDVGKIIILELKAHIALENKDIKTAVQLLQEAAALEEKTAFGYGPPSPVKPAYELLADVYLANKDYVKAADAYAKELARAPYRRLSKEGYDKAMQHVKQQNINTAVPEKIPYFNPLMQR